MMHSIVTGGSSGIGEAVVKDLLARGHRVTVLDLQECAVPGVKTFVIDLTNEENVRKAVYNAEQLDGIATGLVVCHGVRGAFVPALEMDPESMRRLYDVHVVATVGIAKEFVRRLEGSSASIVLISSTTAFGGWHNQLDYGPAKAAVSQVMQNLAIEWAPLNVRVNAVAPGHTMTQMVRDLIQKDNYDISAVEQRMPMGRLASPEEMAASINWLLCEATFVTGQCLPVDGGWTVPGK